MFGEDCWITVMVGFHVTWFRQLLGARSTRPASNCWTRAEVLVEESYHQNTLESRLQCKDWKYYSSVNLIVFIQHGLFINFNLKDGSVDFFSIYSNFIEICDSIGIITWMMLNYNEELKFIMCVCKLCHSHWMKIFMSRSHHIMCGLGL